MAFKGDFEKIDDEIKARLKAIVNADHKTLEKLKKNELNPEELKFYIADKNSKLEMQLKQQELERVKREEYDTDMNRTLFNEYWTDLSEFKKPSKEDQEVKAPKFRRQAHSVVRSSKKAESITLENQDFEARSAGGFLPKLSLTPAKGILQSLDSGDNTEASKRKEDINRGFIMPRMKFDTIFDEYIDKQKQFDHLRNAANKKDDDELKNEIENLKKKMDNLKNSQRLELQHAKAHAARQAKIMLETKLEQVRNTYVDEFEKLCFQHDTLIGKNDSLLKTIATLHAKIAHLEGLISS